MLVTCCTDDWKCLKSLLAPIDFGGTDVTCIHLLLSLIRVSCCSHVSSNKLLVHTCNLLWKWLHWLHLVTGYCYCVQSAWQTWCVCSVRKRCKIQLKSRHTSVLRWLSGRGLHISSCQLTITSHNRAMQTPRLARPGLHGPLGPGPARPPARPGHLCIALLTRNAGKQSNHPIIII